jgi:LPS sulfotransferase NodH
MMGRRAPTPFIVFTNSRSGSAWLIDTLASHPAIAAHGELFHPNERGMPTYGTADVPYFQTYLDSTRGWGRPAQLYRLFRYLSTLYSGGHGLEAVGFKLQYVQAWAHPGMWQYFALRRVRVVHLSRANMLDALLSYQSAKIRRQFHPRRGEPIPEVTMRVVADDLYARLEEREQRLSRSRSRVERFRLPNLEVVYEELVQRRAETLSQILGFLGIDPDPRPLDSAFVRINTRPKADLVENLGELHTRLAGTRFEWMLGDTA